MRISDWSSDVCSSDLISPCRLLCPGCERAASSGAIIVTKRKIGRDAETGLFIPVKEAERRKSTAVVETINVTKPKRKNRERPRRDRRKSYHYKTIHEMEHRRSAEHRDTKERERK